MNITDVRVRLMDEPASPVKATVTLTLNHEFAIHDMTVIQGRNGLFVGMPSRRCSDGLYRDIVHPIDSRSRAELTTAVLDVYRRETGQIRHLNTK